MSITIIKIICSIMMSIVGLIVTQNITDSKIKIRSLKTILLMGFLVIFSGYIYSIQYTPISSIISYIVMIVTYKEVLNISYTKSIISCGILLFSLLFMDFVLSSICSIFMSIDQARNVWYINLLTNILFNAIMLIVFHNKKIMTAFTGIINKIENKKATKIIMFFFLSLLIANLVLFALGKKFDIGTVLDTNLLVMIILFLLVLILVQERTSYDKLSDEYDGLFDCVKVFEEWIENEQLTRHEYKNQLAVLRCLTKEKKVKEKIDSIINETINIDSGMVNQLKNLPNGGFKGLLYYKIAVARNNKLKIETDVSDDAGAILNKLDDDNIRTLSKLIGIYFDNAIEAASETRKKLISLEIYEYDKKVSIVITNSFNNKKDISNRYSKGVSTKGEGRGNGLYFSKKLISKNKWIEEQQDIVDNLYIQKIKISLK